MKKKFRFSRFILLLFSISLLLISSSYVIANIFAIKGTNFYPLLIGTSDKFYDLIYYSGWLFSFIVIYNLIRDEKFRNNFLSFFGLFLLINLIFMFPVYGILLDKPEIIPYKSLFKEDFMRGISFPLFSLFSLFLLIKLFRNLDKKIKNYYIVTLFVIGTIFFIFLQGKIFSRLEDEFAYYFQSLIFSNGNLIQKVTPPSGISSNRLKEIIQLPYIFNNDGSLYSAHFHGWSFLIYLFDLISLREYSNYIIYSLCFLSFFLVTKLYFNKNNTGIIISNLLFLGSPLLLALSGTYMSHLPAMLFLILIVLGRVKLNLDAQHNKNKILSYFIIFIGIFSSIWIRPQSSFPTILSLIIYEFYLLLKTKGKKLEFINLLLIISFSTFSILTLQSYSNHFPSKSIFLTSSFMNQFFQEGCQSLGFSSSSGCFKTYNTLGHSFLKTIFNFLDLVSTINVEHSILYLPIVPILAFVFPFGWNRIIKGKIDLFLLLIFISNLSLFSLYWHNGGESYKGRYLADSIFSLYLILGMWGSLFALTEGKNLAKVSELKYGFFLFFLIGYIYSICFGIKGNYINKEHVPYSSIDKFTKEYPQNSILTSSTTEENKFENFAKSEEITYDFDKSKTTRFSKQQWLSVYNLGHVTLASLAIKIDNKGFLRDKFNNLLLTEISKNEVSLFKDQISMKDCKYIEDFEKYILKKDKKKILTLWESKKGDFTNCSED